MTKTFLTILLVFGMFYNLVSDKIYNYVIQAPTKTNFNVEKVKPVSDELGVKIYQDKVDTTVYIITEKVYTVKNPKTGEVKVFKSDTLGTGFFINDSGSLLTAHHVIDKAVTIYVFTTEGKKYVAQIKKIDSKEDIALLEVKTLKPVPYLKLALEQPPVGSQIFAIGNPKGFGWAFCSGYVSKESTKPFTTLDWMMMNIQINTGNSGGPILNIEGDVVGIAEAFYVEKPGDNANTGISYATKLSTIKKFLNE